MVYCDYLGCKNNAKSGVPRFRLPKNEVMKNMWLINSGNSFSEKLINEEQIFVCADHFQKSDLFLNRIRSRVSFEAVPFKFNNQNRPEASVILKNKESFVANER